MAKYKNNTAMEEMNFVT